MKLLSLLFVVVSSCYISHAQSIAVVSSPDKKLTVAISLQQGIPYYSVQYAGQQFLESSPLGLIGTVGDFSKGLKAAGHVLRPLKETYTLNRSKTSRVNYQASELTCSFINGQKDSLQIIFRVSNQDIAFAYRLPKSGSGNALVTIEREFTGFDLPSGTTTFITPQAPAHSGWEKTKPSYEEEYTREEPVGTASKYKLGYTFPALFHLGAKGWLMISETGVDSNYVGTRLSDASAAGLYTIAFPQPGENGGIGTASVIGRLPLQTSWKTITVGQSLQPMITSTVATDVVKPLLSSDKVFAPGRASWSWIVWQDSSCNYNDQVTFIDLAAKLHCEYILIDALWDVQIGRDKMVELVKYARSKNVDVLLWYNSNGDWNTAPQTPKNLMNTAAARKTEMAWLQKIGVKGMKVDFFGGDKQVTMKLYQEILTDAATYGLVVNFHGTTLPRGWERMYPNFVSSEAVLASENLVFRQAFSDDYAGIATIYPFTRNAVAAMDFGPVFLNNRLSRTQKGGSIRRTTDAFEMATAVLFFSPVQHWGLTPENLESKPAYLFDFIRQVPTVWDETRLIEGYPGKYCVLARRKGTRWYIAAVNGEQQPRTLRLQLPMLAGKKITILRDGQGQESVQEQKSGVAGQPVTITLLAQGGAVLYTN